MPETTKPILMDQEFSIGPLSCSCWKKLRERNEKGRFTGRCRWVKACEHPVAEVTQ